MEEVLWLPALPKLMCVALEDNASHIKHFINPHLAHVRPLSPSPTPSAFFLAHFTVEQARQLFILFFLSSTLLLAAAVVAGRRSSRKKATQATLFRASSTL